MAMPERHIKLIKDAIVEGLDRELKWNKDYINAKRNTAESIMLVLADKLGYVHDGFDSSKFAQNMKIRLNEVVREHRFGA